MALRFFADHCVSNFIMERLRDAGHDVFRLREYAAVDSPDSMVIARAQELDAILLSLNGDFADIVSYPPRRYKGIIAIQVRDHPEIIPRLMRRLTAYLDLYPSVQHYSGKLVVVEVERIRIRE